MTIFGPDVYSGDSGITIPPGTSFCIVKASQGLTYHNPAYAAERQSALNSGALTWAYHFLMAGDSGFGQVSNYQAVAGSTPCAVDFEPTTGSSPTMTDCTNFIDAAHNVGLRVPLVYLPHWYWQQIGSPSLQPMIDRGCSLWSSQYPDGSSYANSGGDSGPGWNAYGGMTPAIWQYTNAYPIGSFTVDNNAYKGTVTDLTRLVNGMTPYFLKHPSHPEIFNLGAHHLTGDEWTALGSPTGMLFPLTDNEFNLLVTATDTTPASGSGTPGNSANPPFLVQHPNHPEIFSVSVHHVTAAQWSQLGSPTSLLVTLTDDEYNFCVAAAS